MSQSPLDLTDDQLGDQLRDLGAHLDVGPEQTDLAARVLGALPDRSTGGRARPPRLLAAAAVVLVLAIGVLAVAPAREAVARWLGIGGVRITRTDQPPVTDPSTTSAPGEELDVDAVAEDLPFSIRLPSEGAAGLPRSARVDPAVPSGLIEVRYPGFTLVALASQPDSIPVLSKVLGPGTTTEPVTVGGHPGLWITGDPHQVAFVDPDGEPQLDTVRGAGDVLLWEEGGVTYRIEGASSLDDALVVARSLR